MLGTLSARSSKLGFLWKLFPKSSLSPKQTKTHPSRLLNDKEFEIHFPVRWYERVAQQPAFVAFWCPASTLDGGESWKLCRIGHAGLISVWKKSVQTEIRDWKKNKTSDRSGFGERDDSWTSVVQFCERDSATNFVRRAKKSCSGTLTRFGMLKVFDGKNCSFAVLDATKPGTAHGDTKAMCSAYYVNRILNPARVTQTQALFCYKL